MLFSASGLRVTRTERIGITSQNAGENPLIDAVLQSKHFSL
jgi:hypothetical protein